MEVSMHSLHDRDGKTRLWFDYRSDNLLDLRGNPLAIVKGEVIHNLQSEQVAFWKNGNVIDLDGSMLLRRGYRKDGPKRCALLVLAKCDDPTDRNQGTVRKAWGLPL
jgi:hypothetical protein